jgi:hypothetical protein
MVHLLKARLPKESMMLREWTLLRPGLLVAVPVLLACLAGCAEDQRGMYRGRMSDGGLLPEDDGGGGGGPDLLINADLQMNTQGPMITIVNPTAGTLIKTSRVTVTADVSRGGGSEVTAVQARLLGQMKAVSLALRGGTTGRYEAEIDLSSQRSGQIAILVDATNTKMITNTAQVTVTYDAGPTLTIREPSGLSYRGSAPIVFDARGDNTLAGGSIKDIKASVQGVAITLSSDKVSDYLWTGTGTIAFGDKAFPVPLAGTQVLRVEATNNNGVTVNLEKPFTIDEQGPLIEFDSPEGGEIVGGVVTMTVKVTDASGVDDTSVVAVWLNDPTKFSVSMARVPGSDTFTARFDTRRLPEPLSLVYPSLSYRARDRLGNQSSRGEVLILDNTSPVMSLQPPKTQVRTKDKDLISGFKCSVEFNPLGGEPTFSPPLLIEDGKTFGQIVTVRARLTERGNNAQGLALEHLSGIDPSSVDMLATPLVIGGATPSPPLLVDVDGKGTCSNLNPLLQPTSAMTGSNQALVLRMVEIAATGSVIYGAARNNALFTSTGTRCDKPAMDTEAEPLCPVLEGPERGFTFVLPKEEGGGNQIWTIGPVSQARCAGLQLDSLNVLPEGAYCVGIRAADKAGNRNVGKPLRICIERPFNNGNGACAAFKAAAGNGTLPSCLGRFDPATQTATTGAGNACALDPVAPYPRPLEPYAL